MAEAFTHEDQQGQALESQAHTGDAAPVKPVGYLTDDQRQQELGQEFDQAGQPQVEDPAGQAIDLPADGHRRHMIGKSRSASGHPEPGKGIVAAQNDLRHKMMLPFGRPHRGLPTRPIGRRRTA